jgi:hypothetical protein
LHTEPRDSTSGLATTPTLHEDLANVKKELQFNKYADDDDNDFESIDESELASAQEFIDHEVEMQEPEDNISNITLNEDDFILVRLNIEGRVQCEKFCVAHVREQPQTDDGKVMVQFLKKSTGSKRLSLICPVQHDMAAVGRENIMLKLTLQSTKHGKHVFSNARLSELADSNFGKL